MSDFAPRITTIKINPEKIREIIGKGGSMIRKIQEETQTEINVEDDGTVEIAAVSGENSRKAIQWIESLTREVEIGALYLGKVTRIMGFGAFVEILPGKEGLVRIGELADYHVPTVEDVVSVGDEVMVVVTEIDRQGRINLSRKAAMQRHLAKEPVEAWSPLTPSSDGRSGPRRSSGSPASVRRSAGSPDEARCYTPAVPDLDQDRSGAMPRMNRRPPHRRRRRRHRRRRSDDDPGAGRAGIPGRRAAPARLRAGRPAGRSGRGSARSRSARPSPEAFEGVDIALF